MTSLLNPVPALRARLLLAQGNLAAAVGWTEERGLGRDDQVSYPREPEHLVLARVLLAQDLPEGALALLDRLQALAASQGRTGSVIEIQALPAVPWRQPATRPARWPRWPRRSRSPTPRATCESSPTRARR